MTAEIAIMNLEAVALAADSAVTASAGGNQKIFSSQNKLFALSDVAPVGVLVYGGATFMSIPWETLIKEYRRKLGRKSFPRLSEYASHFCDFLVDDISKSVTVEHQAEYAGMLVRLVCEEIARLIQQRVSEQIAGDAVRRVEQVDSIVTTETINEYHLRAQEAVLVEDAPDDFLERIQATIQGSRRGLYSEIFKQDLPSTEITKLNMITERAVGAMFADVATQSSGLTTGIVIAGFGQDDLFPSYSEIHVEGLVAGVLKKRVAEGGSTGPDNRAMIVSFAQNDMIYQFMQGIAPQYKEYLHASLLSHLNHYTSSILENLEQYSDSERVALSERLEEIHPEIAQAFVDQIEEIGNLYHAQEIVDVVVMLPKDQLAEMAEALVSLTSLRRKVSLQDETVGGPTDVALITKGDGLVWLKRKHYFPPELNPTYFARRYAGGDEHATRNPQD